MVNVKGSKCRAPRVILISTPWAVSFHATIHVLINSVSQNHHESDEVLLRIDCDGGIFSLSS